MVVLVDMLSVIVLVTGKVIRSILLISKITPGTGGRNGRSRRCFRNFGQDGGGHLVRRGEAKI